MSRLPVPGDAFDDALSRAPLGRRIECPAGYAPEALCALPRRRLGEPPAVAGEDRWHAWELSWLAPDGCPAQAIARLGVACDTPRLIESKSLKLYLNGLNDTRFDSAKALRETVSRDLSEAVGGPVSVRFGAAPLAKLPGACIDAERPARRARSPSAAMLRPLAGHAGARSLHSHLLRTLCPVTGQPDWASVWVRTSGVAVVPASLLSYLLSMRDWSGFQEECVERMFADIQRACRPERLLVAAFYLRRGGLDINPWRASAGSEPPPERRLWRQ